MVHSFIGRLAVCFLVGTLPDHSNAQTDSFAQLKELGTATHCLLDESDNMDDLGELSDATVYGLYHCAKSAMTDAYARSRFPAAGEYIEWQNFTTAPYRSADHADRYVNNYANAIAANEYSAFENAGEFPVGSILAKDSFFLDEDGRVLVGALYLMEKMPEGYNPAQQNWRYAMILPDGSAYASRGSTPSPSVRFCGDCHREIGDANSLFFVPERLRLVPGE